MTKWVIYFIILLSCSFSTFSQQLQPKVIFNSPIGSGEKEIDFFYDGTNTMLVTNEEDLFGYHIEGLKEIFHAKHPSNEFKSPLPLRNNLIAYSDDDENVYILDPVAKKSLFELKSGDSLENVHLSFDVSNDKLIIATEAQLGGGCIIYYVSLKTFKKESKQIFLRKIRLDAIYAVENSSLILIQYNKEKQSHISLVNRNGDIINTINFHPASLFYYNRNGNNFVVYDTSNKVENFRISVFGKDSGRIEQIDAKEFPFNISKIYDYSSDNKFLLIDIRPYHDSIMGKHDSGKDTLIMVQGSNMNIKKRKWWGNSTYIFNQMTGEFIDTISKDDNCKFIPDSNQIVSIKDNTFEVGPDTSKIVTYDFERKQIEQISGSVPQISRIISMDYSPQKNLLAYITEDFIIQVTNLNTSNSLLYSGHYDSLISLFTPNHITFSKNGDYLIVQGANFFVVYKTFDFSIYYISISPTNQYYKRIIINANDYTFLLETTMGLYSFEFRTKKLTDVFTKSDFNAFSRSKNVHSYPLSDSLLLISGSGGFNVFNLKDKQKVFSYVPEDKIQWINIDIAKKTFVVYTRSQKLLFSYNVTSQISVNIQELDNRSDPDLFFPFDEVFYSNSFKAEVDQDFSYYSLYRQNHNRSPAFIMKIPSLFSNMDNFDLINARNPLIDIGNNFIVALNTDGIIEVYDMIKKSKVLNFISFKNNSWLAYSPSGYFDIDHSLLPKVFWFDFESQNYFPFDYVYNEFFEPQLIALTFSRKLKQPLFDIGNYLKIPSLKLLKIKYITEKGNNYACLPKIDQTSTVKLTHQLAATGVTLEVTQDKSCPIRVELPKKIAIKKNTSPKANISNILNSVSNVTQKKGKLFYASIGVGKYPSITGLRQLKSTTRSEKFFENIFAKYNLQFKKFYDTIFYFKPLTDSCATKDNIINYFQNIIDVVKEEDVLIIYLCGHGIIPPQSELFSFLPYDVNLSNRDSILSSGVNTGLLVDFVRNLRSVKVVFMIDACQSGGSLESISKIGDIKTNSILASDQQQTSINLIASSSPYSYTFQSSDSVSYLLMSFDGAIADLLKRKKIITIENIKAYMTQGTKINRNNDFQFMFNDPQATFNLLGKPN